MAYFSVFDKETGDYLHSGRNRKTKAKAIEEAFEMWAESQDEPIAELRKGIPKREREEWLREIGFVVEKHKKKIAEELF